MKKSAFLVRFLIALALLVLVCQSLFLGVLTGQVRQEFRTQTLAGMRSTALFLRDWARQELHDLFGGQPREILSLFDGQRGYQLSLLDATGEVLQDTALTPGLFGDKGPFTELDEARWSGEGISVRWSEISGTNLLNLALSVKDNGRLLGYVRISTPIDDLDTTLGDLFVQFALLNVGLWAVVFLITWRWSARFSGQMAALVASAGAFARGESVERPYFARPRELKELSLALGGMYGQLESRIKTIEEQRNELSAILDGMGEGVLVLDAQLRITTLNPAARRLFPSVGSPLGQSLIAVCRNSALDDLARKLASGEATSQLAEVVLQDLETTLLVQGTVLSSGPVVWGSVLVMSNITQLKRLEVMRRDFVANVSHELRTPITNIKGFVETLQNATQLEPERTQQFLDIIGRHADRLDLIIDDLLSLSKLETNPPDDRDRHDVNLGSLAAGVRQFLDAKARARKAKVELVVPSESIVVRGFPSLLEQALVNLVENALKFSPAKSVITVTVGQDGDGAFVEIRDPGPGIPAADQQRIFERFFRTQEGRNAEGTGLGLAIVKHIAAVHRATITVQSPAPGQRQGSAFTLRFNL